MLCQRLPVKEPRKLCIRGPYRARLPLHEVDIDTELDRDIDAYPKKRALPKSFYTAFDTRVLINLSQRLPLGVFANRHDFDLEQD